MSSLPLDAAAGTGRTLSEVAAEFLAADWSLLHAPKTVGGELHPYPARFIPALPRQILHILDVEGPVLDPFCGSGTTLQEARRRGLSTFGNDLNPIACLISRVRTSEWEHGDAASAASHAAALTLAVVSPGRDDRASEIPRVDHWFPDWAQLALSRATAYLGTLDPADPWHDRVALAISSVVVRLSRQDSDTRYAAVQKSGDLNFAAQHIAKAVVRVADWLRHNSVSGAPKAVIGQGDARNMPHVPDDSMSAAVFSPPYPNAYEYWLYHKYRMYWLDYDPIAVRANELGARPHYSRKNGLTEVDFAVQMRDVFREIARVLRAHAPVAVVIGDSVIGGRWIDNATLLADAVRDDGFKLVARAERLIHRTRSSFNNAHSRGRVNEHVLLFEGPS